MSEPIELIVLTETRRWESAIRRSFPDANTVWALNLDSIPSLYREKKFGSVIIELSDTNFEGVCRRVQSAYNNPQQWNFFAVGEIGDLSPSALKLAGFVDWAPNFVNFSRVTRAIQTYQERAVRFPLESIEQRIWRTLPWASGKRA